MNGQACSVTMRDWPPEDLEWLGACPVCDETGRSMLFAGLTDRVFRVAPGRWTLWRCAGCRAAYLDPRPTEATIGRAYATYFTHAELAAQRDGLVHPRPWPFERLKQVVRNDHLNRAFGHRLPCAVPGGAAIAALAPGKRAEAEHFIRHLPPPRPGQQLLDVGCGNGTFLRVARSLGYEALGIEPDERAATAARQAGFEVCITRLPGAGLSERTFSHITLSHVFEHVHRPLEALQEAFRLLERGGRLWLAMPNLAASGRQLFGADWRGLEPPRHLVLYDASTIRSLLLRCGFVSVEVLPPAPVANRYCRSSLRIRAGLDPSATAPFPGWDRRWRRRAAALDRAQARTPETCETLTVIAFRPAVH